MTAERENLLAPPPTLLPDDPAATLLAAGSSAREAAAAHPDSALAWALLAEAALQADDEVAGYAYARTGYHRSLDALRRNGWRGAGPVPWSHEPNRGFLRSLAALARAAHAVGETPEYERCVTFLRDSSPEGAAALGL